VVAEIQACPHFFRDRNSEQCAHALPAQAPQSDLLVKGGRVIDPKNGVDDIRDVAVLRLDKGQFGFVDVRGGRITGRKSRRRARYDTIPSIW
jgi:hypothetical protein